MNKIQGWSIKTKIITYFVGLCLASLVAITFVVGTQIHTTLKESAKHELINIVSEKSNQYNLIFKRLSEELDSVKFFASDTLKREDNLSLFNKSVLMPWVGDGTGTGIKNGYGSTELNAKLVESIPKLQRIGKMLEGVGSSNELISLAYFVNAEGMFVSDRDYMTKNIGQSEAWEPKNRPWFKAAISHKKTIWTKAYIDVATKDLIVTVASPLYDMKDKLLGVAAFDVLLKTIQEDILTINIKYDNHAFLVGFDGKALVTPTIEKQNKSWDSNFESETLTRTKNNGFNIVVLKMVKAEKGVGVYKDTSGNNKFLAYVPLKNLDASIGVVVSEEEVVAPALRIIKWMLIVASVISLLAITFGIMLGNSISKPILELTNIANDISNGKVELKRLTVTRDDELGMLTKAFNRLISSLKIAMKL